MPVDILVLMMIAALVIIYVVNYFKHNKKLNNFYDSLDSMANNYYKLYPRTDDYYFADLVVTFDEAKYKVWITDFNDFIIDERLLQELYDGSNKYLAEQEAKAEADKIPDDGFLCPWCKVKGGNNFQFLSLEGKVENEEFNKRKVNGTMQCINCGATSSVGYLENNEFYMDSEMNEKV